MKWHVYLLLSMFIGSVFAAMVWYGLPHFTIIPGAESPELLREGRLMGLVMGGVFLPFAIGSLCWAMESEFRGWIRSLPAGISSAIGIFIPFAIVFLANQ